MPKKSHSEEGFAHLLIILGALTLVGVFAAANIETTKEFSQSETGVKGVLIAKGGDDGVGSLGSDSDDSNSGSSNSGSGSSGGSSSGSSGGGSSSTNTPTPKPTIKSQFRAKPSFGPFPSSGPESGVRVKTEENRTDIRFSETERIKTRIEDDRTRIDVYQGGVKIRYEIRDGRVIIKAETEEGEDVPEQELFKIEDRLGADGIKVATDGGKLLIARNNIGAVSSFPFQIDLNTNQLIASTSAGVKILTTLPDQAVQNLIAANVISQLNPLDIANQAQTGGLTSVKDIITLGERNGVPVYQVNGLKQQKLLGFIPVTVETTVFVSAESGQLVAQEQSILSSIIDILSP